MSINFGIVSNYISNRGFGFVRGLLLGNSSEVSLHITTIKRTDPELRDSAATLLASNFHFWFETEVTPKGTQVRSILSSEQVRRGAITEPNKLIERVEFFGEMWDVKSLHGLTP